AGVPAAGRERVLGVAGRRGAATLSGDRGGREDHPGGRHAESQQPNAAVAGKLMRDRFKVRGLRFEEGPTPPAGEQGYMLLGLMVAIAIILLMLGVAASKAAFSIHRDREVETVRRGNQYVRAIREFYLKNGSHYPGSIEQLEKTNNVRFLRQRYIDPLTGKDDWRLIVVGQNQTTVKGFFGEELQGLPNAGLGSAAGLASGFGGTRRRARGARCGRDGCRWNRCGRDGARHGRAGQRGQRRRPGRIWFWVGY